MSCEEQLQKLIDIALKLGEYECVCPGEAGDDVDEDDQCLNCAIKEILQR